MAQPEDETEFLERVIADWPAGEPPTNFTDRVIAATRPGSKSRPRWPAYAVGLAVAMVVAAAAAIVFHVQLRREPPGIVTFVEGAVEVESRDGRRPLSEGNALESAHRVLTTTGRVQLALLKRARVSIGPGALFVVGPGVPAASLQRGRAAFDVVPGTEEFRVETPAGNVIVTGTAFEIEVLNNPSEDQDMRPMKALGLGTAAIAAIGVAALVHVSRGAVRVENTEGSAPVRAGQQVTLVAGKSPRPGQDEQASLSPHSTERAQLAAVSLALENARLKSEVVALKSKAGEPKIDVAAQAQAKEKESSDERQRVRSAMTHEEREFVKDAQKNVLSAQAQELRRFCPELLYGDAKVGDEALVIKAATLAIATMMKLKETKDEAAQLRLARSLSSANRPAEGASLAEKTAWQLNQEEPKLRAELEKNVSHERAAELAKANREIEIKLDAKD